MAATTGIKLLRNMSLPCHRPEGRQTGDGRGQYLTAPARSIEETPRDRPIARRARAAIHANERY
ncbi:MAG: hypothetical protein HYX50_00035 [Chloroflexi bacterium]|nr:hypothetical protein [Chloroflexota bacterium]